MDGRGQGARRRSGQRAPREAVLLCPAGFEGVVARVAGSELPRFAPVSVGSGYIRARTTATAAALRAFPCATNAFSVVASVRRGALDQELGALAGRLSGTERPQGLPARTTFRLRVHDDGRFASTTTPPARRLEADVASWSGLRPAPRGARIEVWVIRRFDQPETVLATKLTAGIPAVDRGALRPEVAAALARVVPVRGKVVVDPFAGSGAIAAACLQAGAERVVANDRDRHPGLGKLGRDARVSISATDFRELDAGAVDVVVTDPPWGLFEAPDEGVERLYADFGAAARRWLRPGGVVVVLTGAPEAAVEALLRDGGLASKERFSVLINGRKAAVVHAAKGAP